MGLLTVILRFLLVVRNSVKLGAPSSIVGMAQIADSFFSSSGPDCKEGPELEKKESAFEPFRLYY